MRAVDLFAGPGGDCVLPPAGASDNGNGYYRHGTGGEYAHRRAYREARGAIPEGLVLDHLCRNRWCCNPDHLEPVTNAENILRGESPPAKNARKERCPNGHGPEERAAVVRVVSRPASCGVAEAGPGCVAVVSP